MYSISNGTLTVQISSKGAELQSIYHNEHQLEYMWSAGEAWPKKSPLLFPIIGELKNKSYTYKGKQYNLSRHGFAREKDFTVSAQSDTSITFTIKADEQTLAVYPFEFVLSVTYSLASNNLSVTYTVENAGNEEMYFSVGGHPAFKVPLVEGTVFEDYELVFDQTETAGRWPLTVEGLTKPEPTPLLKESNVLRLNKDLFAADAIVFKNLASREVTIQSIKTEHGLKVSFPGFPFLGIWETKGGDFVCIEPWCGIADNVNASGRLEEKEGINKLAPKEKFEATFKVSLF